jgi:hypothetical protein
MAKVIVKALKLVEASNDNRLYVSAVPGDNVYVTGGVQLNLSPGQIQDPKALGVVGPSQVPVVNPGVFSQSMGGYRAEVIPTTGGLSAYKLKYYNPDGTEFAAGAYNGSITGGTLVIEIPYES